MNNTRFVKGHNVPELWRKAVSEARKGHTPWNKGTKGVMKAWNKGKRRTWLSGKPFIKGRIPWNKDLGSKTSFNKKLRTSPRFKHWREQVFERDNWTCQHCFKRGGILHPHHLKRLSEFPELCYELSNGITLCIVCHKLTDTYGNRNIKRKPHSATC